MFSRKKLKNCENGPILAKDIIKSQWLLLLMHGVQYNINCVKKRHFIILY